MRNNNAISRRPFQEPSPTTVFLSLGSNLGQRKKNLEEAVRLLGQHPAIQIAKCSSIYETKPQGPVPQDFFWNLCLQLYIAEDLLRPAGTTAPAHLSRHCCARLLLEYCQSCEKQLGRDRSRPGVRWGPRSIDIDIIDYGYLQLCSEDLKLPHPYFLQRLFVLVPLAEIATHDFLNAYNVRQNISRLEALEQEWGYKIDETIDSAL
ncbi:MAG: 2-amino-4-hydroxy-6-hydroxymethyldihydropteridine diphosphokinase [Spirochaetota bacterium]